MKLYLYYLLKNCFTKKHPPTLSLRSLVRAAFVRLLEHIPERIYEGLTAVDAVAEVVAAVAEVQAEAAVDAVEAVVDAVEAVDAVDAVAAVE